MSGIASAAEFMLQILHIVGAGIKGSGELSGSRAGVNR